MNAHYSTKSYSYEGDTYINHQYRITLSNYEYHMIKNGAICYIVVYPFSNIVEGVDLTTGKYIFDMFGGKIRMDDWNSWKRIPDEGRKSPNVPVSMRSIILDAGEKKYRYDAHRCEEHRFKIGIPKDESSNGKIEILHHVPCDFYQGKTGASIRRKYQELKERALACDNIF